MGWMMKIISAEFIAAASEPFHYPEGNLPEVAFVGKSNVGKSSLINRLVQRKSLARTSRTPGRTQQIIFFNINNEISFVDLPGYGFAKVPQSVQKKWGPMVETYLKERSALKLVIFILDIRRDLSAEDVDLIRWLNFYCISHLFVLTKTDKLSRSQARMRKNAVIKSLGIQPPADPVLFSAKTGEGKEKIWNAIKNIMT